MRAMAGALWLGGASVLAQSSAPVEIELLGRLALPSAGQYDRSAVATSGPLLAVLVETTQSSANIDVFRRSGSGAMDWEAEGTVVVPSSDAWNLTFVGEDLAYEVGYGAHDRRIQLASKQGGSWEVAGELSVEGAGNVFGQVVVGDEQRLVTIGGRFWQNAEIVTWIREPFGWSLLQRLPIVGAVYISDLAMDGPALAASVYYGAGQGGGLELFEWDSDYGWRFTQSAEPGGLNGDVEIRGDVLAVSDMWSSHDGSAGRVDLWRRGTAGWGYETTVVAPVEADGEQGRIGYQLHFLESGDLVAQAFPPPPCPDPTCEPGPPRGSRVYQFSSRRGWALVGWWRDEPSGPEGQVGYDLASYGPFVLASANALDPALRVFGTVQPSPLEIPTLHELGSVALALLLLGAGLRELRASIPPSSP
jgi:hypothetical protein